jgi:hypothetical protein
VKPLRRLAALAAVLAALVAPVVVATGAVDAGAAGSSRALVIVDTTHFGGGVYKSVITFDGSISGLEALQLAGTDPITLDYGGSLGEAICKLYGVGDEPTPSQCPGGWLYYRAVGGASGWTQSNLGVSNTRVSDGDVEGWKYGGGPPPFESFCDAVGCAPPPTPAPPSGGSTDGGTTSNGSGNTGQGDPSAAVVPLYSAGDNTTAPPSTQGGTGPSTSAPTTPAPVRSGTTTTAKPTAARKHSANEIAIGPPHSGEGGGGSPWGVIVAASVLATGAGAAIWLRRRRTRASPTTPT